MDIENLWLRRDRSTHIQVLSEVFLTTIIGANHVVAFVTGVMMFCDWSRSRSAFNLLQYMSWVVCAMWAHNGWMFITTEIWILPWGTN